jgi:hypothetical protein
VTLRVSLGDATGERGDAKRPAGWRLGGGGGGSGPSAPFELAVVEGVSRKALPLTGSTVIGRDRSEGADVVVNAAALSGAHCQVRTSPPRAGVHT